MMPPVAGTLSWCYSLRTRITDPYERIPGLGQGITEREEYRDIKKLYESIIRNIEEYQKKLL